MASEVAVIAGAGAGLSASLARLLTREGYRVVLAARNTAKLAALVEETGALAVETDVADPASVASLFEAADKQGSLALAVFNASGRTRGPIAEIDPDAVKQALLVGVYDGFLVGQQATRRLLARGSGSILFTGASASIKGFPNSAGFAMPKFGLRGLAQSMARELGPKTSMSRISSSTVRSSRPARSPNGRTASCRPMPSPRPISRPTASTAAPGVSRSNCGPLSRRSDRSGLPFSQVRNL
jgi:NAD(P)-dependent dehydrogenase (short-subunit alcohol dehydrogenase family)